MSDAYPRFAFFPRNISAPSWVKDIVSVFKAEQSQLDTQALEKGLSSDDALSILRPGFVALDFEVESGKRQNQKVHRPVLFGDDGVPRVRYEIDGFHDKLGIALEVEAGRGAGNNADYRDIVRASLIADTNYLVLAMPLSYKYKVNGKSETKRAYEISRDRLDAIFSSQRISLPLHGVLLIGY